MIAILAASLCGLGAAGNDSIKEVPAPNCGCSIEYAADNVTEFIIGDYGDSADNFKLAVNETSFLSSCIKVIIGNDSIIFQYYCDDCDNEWKTIHTETFSEAIILHFIIYNEKGDGASMENSDFKSAKGKKGDKLIYVVTDFTVDTTGDEVRVSYDAIDPC